MRHLTEQERRLIESECDMLKGNINRMCVTDDLTEICDRVAYALRVIYSIIDIATDRFTDQT